MFWSSVLLALWVFALASSAYGQAGEWTWMGGSNMIGQRGAYGALGTPAAENIPGARTSPVGWTDKDGNLWLFGGWGFDANGNLGSLNDLWKFNFATGEWTWMSGSSAMNCGLDTCVGLGSYGTLGTFATGNTPGGRTSAASWVDLNGNLWLFGGLYLDANTEAEEEFNDIWEFNTTTAEWAWQGGSGIPGANAGYPGVYGTLGTPSTSNVPGSRYAASYWTDPSGIFWLFGGYGMDSVGLSSDFGDLNDLWRFNPSTNEWTWMGGSNTIPNVGGRVGVYGTLGTPSPGNLPGSRFNAASWTDSKGNLWLFGGLGFDSTGTFGNEGWLNDLWEFNPSSNEWTWMGGSNVVGPHDGQPGNYGTLGTAGAGNAPGSRNSSSSWTDAEGNLWLFGGQGYDSAGSVGVLNDLWEFNPPTNEWTWMAGSNSINSDGLYGTLGTPSAANAPGARSEAPAWMDSSDNLWLFGGGGPFGLLNDLWEYQLTAPLPAAATPTFDVGSGTYTSSQTITISDSTPNAAIYYTTNGTKPTTSSTLYSGAITVSSTETIEAIAVAPGYSASAVASATYTIIPSAATPVFTPPAGIYTSVQSVTITDATAGASIYYTTDGTSPTTSSNLYTGALTISSTETVKALAVATGYGPSAIASSTYTINLPPPNFSLSSGAQSLTVSSGGKVSVTLMVTPQNSFNSAVTFACSGLPAGASCSFNPPTVTPAGSAISTTLTIAAAAKTAMLQHKGWPYWPATALALTGLVFVRKKRAVVFLLALIVLLTGFVTACGGGGSSGSPTPTPTPTPTISTVTITATSGTLQQSVTLSLTVN